MSEQTEANNESIIARGGDYYRRMRYVVALILMAAGCWFAYDGWVTWPEINNKRAEVQRNIDSQDEHTDIGKKRRADLTEQLKDLKYHSDLDILVQKLLAFGLPVLGVLMILWARHNSRGEIKLVGDELTAPGHPTVKMEQIVALDKQLWDKKDIAFVEYDTGSAKGRIRLDAFVYQTDPIVKIFDHIEAMMKEENAENLK